MSDWDADFDAEFVCPVCGSGDVVPASGSEDSPYLIVGAFPGDAEVKEHSPMVGKTGGVLKAELRKLGRDISEFRITNLWHHSVPTDKKDPNYEKCFQFGATLAIKEAQNKRAILLIGAETVKFFCNCSVETCSGLVTHSQYLSAPVMPCIQPTTVFKGGVGELRLSITKWVRFLDELERNRNED